MVAPAGASALGLSAPQEVAISTELVFREWTGDTTAPEPRVERLGEHHMQAVAEEAGKQAQTRYLAKKFKQAPTAIRKYVDLAWAEAEKRDGIEPELLIAIMQKESSLRPKVQSRYGAQGLMQVVRRWHREKLDRSESLFDPEVNIRVGADILEEYLELAGGSLTKALHKYSGNARGYPNKILNESRKLAQVADQAAVNG
ncbi:hypothetical protein CKA81_16795 [Pollutimonas thiosulfatoxidans]|uniref:Transglycosylase SLT domain-containing protein n=2 Tax=Pollutimonas thiosulfatoxidans TaxID=2028345 RepID=A0A451FSZ8_9BURK|nr:hypothetical protein CKA81_16795 [Pollutimonas thiosulfatoxidans]